MSKRPHKWRDVAWKRAIIDGADDFVGFVMKKLDDKRDQSRDITGVAGMELHVKDSDTDKGMLVSDAYLNVPVKGGDDCNVACLVEQQHDHKDDFPERIFNSWVRLRASRPERRVTAIAVYTGNSKDINHYEENCLECEASLKFNTFHLPSCKPEQLREDEHPFACVMYAGLLSYGTEDNAALREKYALEILNMTERRGYNDRQKKYILQFAHRIFFINDPAISQEVKEAYKMQTISLEEYVAAIDMAEARVEAREEGELKGKLETKIEIARALLAKNMSVNDIAMVTGLEEHDVMQLQ